MHIWKQFYSIWSLRIQSLNIVNRIQGGQFWRASYRIRCSKKKPQDTWSGGRFIVMWDNVSFHRTTAIANLFDNHPQMQFIHLPFLSVWRWKICQSVSLHQAMEEVCGNTDAETCQGWIRPWWWYFPDVWSEGTCDVDEEVLWSDAHGRRDGLYLPFTVFCV